MPFGMSNLTNDICTLYLVVSWLLYCQEVGVFFNEITGRYLFSKAEQIRNRHGAHAHSGMPVTL